MITREELFDKIQREIAIEYCFSDLVEIIESGAVKSVFDKTYDSLEAQLANTEQLTCESCKWFNALTVDGVISCGIFGEIKSEIGFDYDFLCNKHEEKDTQ